MQANRMRAAATLATTPSETNGSSDGQRRDRHVSASSATTSRLVPPTHLYPVTRTPSAPFPVTRTPSAQGLAMIQTKEDSPPPTNISFEDAVRILHATERRLRSEVQMDIVDLRLQMTASKIERVTFKASRVHALRTLLNNCRVLCRQEEDVMRDFARIKEKLSNIRGDIDEDGYEDTKAECLVHGGKLTDIRRRQRRLAGHAEVMREELSSVMAPEDIASAGEDEETFDVERFKRESSQQPLLSLAPTALTSYPLFNSAPYSRGPSGDKLNQQLKSSSPITTFQTCPKDNRNITDNASSEKTVSSAKTTISKEVPNLLIKDVGSGVAAMASYPTTEDEQDQAHFPTSRKKRTTGLHRRPKTTSMSSAVSSDTDGEEYNWTNDRTILQANAALIEEKLKRKEQHGNDLENGRQTIITTEYTVKNEKECEMGILDQNITVESEKKRLGVEKTLAEGIKEEQTKAITKENDKKLIDEEEIRKVELKAKEQEAMEKIKVEEEAKKKLAADKKKADIEAKKKATEMKKKLEAETKKKTEDEEKQKAEDERKKKAEAVAKRLEEKKAQAKKIEEEKKKAEEEKKKLEELKKAEIQAKQKAIAEKRLAEIEAKKAEEDAKKIAEEKRKLAEAEIKEKAEQEDKMARLQKVEEEKKRAWEEKKLAEQKLTESEKSQESTKSQDVIKEKDHELKEKHLEVDDVKKSKVIKARSASTDKRQKVAELVKDASASGQEGSEDFIFDTKHQIENKEDLFAAIGDTSLAAGRLAKKRRGTEGVSKEEIPHASKLVPDTSVQSNASQEGKKSRTSSRERPKDLAITGTFGDDSSVAGKRAVKSRTVSKERLSKVEFSQERPCISPATASKTPSEELLSYEDKSKKAKSRTASRERPVSTQGYSEEFTNLRPEFELSTENEERAFKQSVTDSKPVRSRTSSDSTQSKMDIPRSRQDGVNAAQEEVEEEMMQQYTSRSKFAASRTSSSEDENISTTLPFTDRPQKSRTSSKERPNSRQKNLQGMQNVVDMDVVERPHSATSIGSSAKVNSRTVSRERPNTPKGAQTSTADMQKRRSRTSSKDSQAQEMEREELFEPQDVDYETMEKDHHPRRFRDEAALDFEEQESSKAVGKSLYSNATHDSGAIDDLDDKYDIEEDLRTEDEDEEPPPTEPIFDYSNAQNANNLPTYELRPGQNEQYDDPDFEISRQTEFNGYIADAEQYASEIEHSEDELGNRATRTKKVSFAAENEQFTLRPEAEVKVIPGTNMFCFAPSSTHEQPTDFVDGGKVTKTQNISKTAPQSKDILSEQQTQDQDESHKKDSRPFQSVSPKAFLRQMTGIGGGKNVPRDSSKASSGGQSRERSNSILDTILRRGRSRSQGSQGSSRQESMERGGSETGAIYMVADSYKTVESSIGESEKNIGSNIATISDPGTSTFFKRIGKKKKPIKSTDFDELFARGHALSAELEENRPNATATHGVNTNGFSYSSDTVKNACQQSDVFGPQSSSGPLNSQPPTPFAMFSQEEAFKQSQQGAGLSYAEKVQSYLDDQQQTAPSIQQSMDLQYVGTSNDQHKSGSEKEHRSRSRKKSNTQDQPTVQMPPKKAASYANPEDVRIDSMNSKDVMSSASLPTTGGVTSDTNIPVSSFNNMHMRTKDPAGEDVTQTGRSESTTSNKQRQMTPEAFLKNLGEFVKKAEVDPQHAQPVWPAIVQSPNDLPLTKQSHMQTETNNILLPTKHTISTHAQRVPKDTARTSPNRALNEQRQRTHGNSPRPVSPLNKPATISDKQLRPASPYGVAADLRPSDRSPSPYGLPSKQPFYLQQQQHQPNIPTIYQQSPSPRPGSGPGMQRIAPSPGKSYLDQPSSSSPDPFQSRIEEQTLIDGTGPLPQLPSSSSAIENSSSILADLTMRTAQQHHLSESENDYDINVMKYGGRNVDRRNQRIPSPRKEILPNRAGQVEQEPPIPAGDAHIPMQLKPDPLTAHELQNFEQPQQLRIAYPDEDCDSKKENYEQPSIRDTDLYRRLQEGLSNIDKLVQSETFKNEITRAGVDYRKYSHHLGRAEFGVLKKRSSLGNLTSTDGSHSGFDRLDTAGTTQTANDINNLTGFPVQQSASATQLMGRTRFGGGTMGTTDSSRETSGERPGSITGFHRTGSGVTSSTDPRANTTTHIGKRTSRQSSHDSSIGRPDSRLSDNIPDLETEQHSFTGFVGGGVRRTGSSSSRGFGGDNGIRPQVMEIKDEEQRLQERLDIKPHPEVYEKRQEVLQEMAAQKQTVKEAKVTKRVISGSGDGPEFTYVIDRTGGALEQPNGTGPPQPPLRLHRGISPSSNKAKAGKSKSPATEIRRIDFERDTPIIKKKKTATCCQHM